MKLKYIMLSSVVITAGILLFGSNIFARSEVNRPMRKFQGARLFHAKGQHKCWSSDYIGYTCDVEGRGYTDCNQAINILKRENCCNKMLLNNKPLRDGVSSEFKLLSCSWIR